MDQREARVDGYAKETAIAVRFGCPIVWKRWGILGGSAAGIWTSPTAALSTWLVVDESCVLRFQADISFVPYVWPGPELRSALEIWTSDCVDGPWELVVESGFRVGRFVWFGSTDPADGLARVRRYLRSESPGCATISVEMLPDKKVVNA